MNAVLGRALCSIPAAGRCIPGHVDLEFNPQIPVEVTMTMTFAPLWDLHEVHVSRAVIDAALKIHSKQFGYGDFMIESVSSTALRVIVKAPHLKDGWRTFLVERKALEDFMLRTFVVSPGNKDDETMAPVLDAALQQILEAGA